MGQYKAIIIGFNQPKLNKNLVAIWRAPPSKIYPQVNILIISTSIWMHGLIRTFVNYWKLRSCKFPNAYSRRSFRRTILKPKNLEAIVNCCYGCWSRWYIMLFSLAHNNALYNAVVWCCFCFLLVDLTLMNFERHYEYKP